MPAARIVTRIFSSRCHSSLPPFTTQTRRKPFPTQMPSLSSSAPSSSLSPELLRHPLSSPGYSPPANDIANSWILEFALRQPIPNHLANAIFFSLPFSSSFHPHLRKTLLLHRLDSETHSRSISERTLHSLELIEEHNRIHGAGPSNCLKEAYCAAALECTAAARRRGAEEFADAVKRIWKERIADIDKSEAAVGLVSEKLVEWAGRMERRALSGEGGEELFDRDAEEGLRLVRAYLDEAMEEMGPSFLEIVAAEVKENTMHTSRFACETGGVKDADQCIGTLEAKCKSFVDDGIDEDCEGLGDVCMRGLEDNDVLKVSKVSEVVSTENLEDDGIREESRGLCNASTEGHGSYGAEGFQLESMVEAEDKEEFVNLGGHDMSSPVGGLIHKLDPSEVSKVKEASENYCLDPHLVVEEPPPDAEIAAASALISISSGDAILNEPAKHSTTSNAVLPDSVAEVPAGLDSSTGALVKDKCSLVPLPDVVNEDPLDSKHLEGSGIVEECNKDAEPTKHKNILDHHALFERNPTGYTSELSDDSQPLHQLNFVNSTDLSIKQKTRKVSPTQIDDIKLVKRRAIKRWTILEENTLKKAVAKHGVGNWKLILFCNAEIFKGRTEIDLKDKWRNISRYSSEV